MFRDLLRYLHDRFRAKTLIEAMQEELEEAQFKKLQAETGVEYAQSVVQYNEQRIKRLEQRIMEQKSTVPQEGT